LDVGHVDLAPHALGSPGRVALEEALVVEALPDAVDPAPAQRGVYRLLRRYRPEARAHLVDLDPQLVSRGVVRAQPRVERLEDIELAVLGRVDGYDRVGHILERRSEGRRSASRGSSARAGAGKRRLVGAGRPRCRFRSVATGPTSRSRP